MRNANTRNANARQRGIAIMAAIICIGLVGLALAAMGRQLKFDSQRTNRTLQDAQLYQLSHAAAVIGKEQPVGKEQVMLPDELTELGYSLAIDVQEDGDVRRVEVDASHIDHDLQQTHVYQKVEGGWQFVRSE